MDPTKAEWWNYFISGWIYKCNAKRHGNPLVVDIDEHRKVLSEALQTALAKRGSEGVNLQQHNLSTGLSGTIA